LKLALADLEIMKAALGSKLGLIGAAALARKVLKRSYLINHKGLGKNAGSDLGLRQAAYS
jgi:hypothetical protein